jgi:membrane-associated protein
MQQLIELFVHLDQHLAELTVTYGGWIYGLLFLIIFCETGLVVTPFLPGDSLLFAAGTLAALGSFNIWLLGAMLIVAAVVGDTVNYHVGYYLGPRVIGGQSSRWLNQRHLDRTHRFFERYGARTIILARFVPIVRTFAPFVAGIGTMSYRRFLVYNVVGGVIWVTGFLGAGYWFGNVPIVKKHFSLVILGIIVVSLLPMLFEFLRAMQPQRNQDVAPAPVASPTNDASVD